MPNAAAPGLDALSARQLLARAWAVYRRALPASVVVCAVAAPPFVVADRFAARAHLGFLDSAHALELPQLLTGVMASIAMARLFLDADAARTPSPWRALGLAVRRWPAAAAVAYVSGLIVSAGVLLAVVPGAIAALMLCLTTPLLAGTALDANQVMRRSKSLTFGHRKRLAVGLGVALLASVGAGEAASWLADAAIGSGNPLGPVAIGVACVSQIVALLLEGFLVAAQVSGWLALEAAARGSTAAPAAVPGT